MKKVYITRGLPASGKSTWAKQLVADNPGMYKRVNKDDLRAMMDHAHHTKSNEKFVEKVRDMIILESLEAGKHVIVDDTNLSDRHLNRIKELVHGKAQVELVDFLHVDVETCIQRDLQRPNSVGERVIRRMLSEYHKAHPQKLEQDASLPRAIMCDLDGTLAIIDHRSPYDAANCDQDELNVPVGNIVKAFRERGYTILFVSGREDKFEEPTRTFLTNNLGPDFEYHLLMRKSGDVRKDSIIKQEIFEGQIRPHYYIEFILDDRNQVVDMWRGLGLTCLQVNYGDF